MKTNERRETLVRAKNVVEAYLITNSDVLDESDATAIKSTLDKLNTMINRMSPHISLSNHSMQIDGYSFYTAQIVDSAEGTTYDMTVIFVESNAEDAPEIVGYYYGEPDPRYTLDYVNTWLDARSACTQDYSNGNDLPPAFSMNRAEYISFLEQLLIGGEINQSGFDVLRELVINYPEQ